MLDMTKALINNMNQFKFLRNIDRVTLKKDAHIDTNNIVNEKGSKEEIERLQNDVRVNNLKVFCSSYFSLRLYRFLVVTLPACLTAGAIGLFATPTRVNKEDTATYYTREETTYKSDEGLMTSVSDVYDLNDAGEFFHHKVAESENAIVESSPCDNISLKIHDGEQCLTARVNILPDGALGVYDVGTILDYYDKNEYKDFSFEEVDDEEYILLFNRVVELIKNSVRISEEDKDLLDSLAASEKKVIILSIMQYQNHGDAQVLLSKTRIPRRIALAIIAGIYDIIVLYFYISMRKDIDIDVLDYQDGLLKLDHTQYDASIWTSSLRMKEAFLAAERERIMLLFDEINSNVEFNDRNRLLTGYEKRLIKKESKKK